MPIWISDIPADVKVMVLLCLGIVLFLALYQWSMEAKSRREREQSIKKDYGKNIPVKKLSKDIDRLYRVLGGEIDDITFCDLQVEEFLKHFDHTKSNLGEQYLYYQLRNGKDCVALEEMQHRRDEMQLHGEEVQAYQLDFLSMGKGKYHLWDLLEEGIDIDRSWVFPIYLLSFTIPFILLLIAVMRQHSIFFILLLLLGNGIFYKKLNEIKTGYLINLLYLRLMIDVAKRVCSHKDNFFEEEKKTLREILQKIAPLKRALGHFSMPGTVATDAEFMKIYINALTMHEGRKLLRSKKYITTFAEELKEMYLLLGKMDMDCAMVSFCAANDVVKAKYEKDVLFGVDIHHPLLFEQSVGNSFTFEEGSLLLTGSNASGKSTFLRAVGLNELLALTVGVVFAKEWVTDRYGIFTAIDLHDSMEKGVSYFMAETMAIGRMLNTRGKNLCLLDEIFRGTNTIDRIAAAAYTLQYLARGNFVIAATHDIELTELLNKDYCNCHFEEEVRQGDIYFDYQLKKGPASSRNAIAILQLEHYPKEITDGALALAEQLERKV